MRQQPRGHQGRDQRGDRDDQGQQHGQQRTERDEQYDRRRQDPDAGADADRGAQRVFHRRATDVDLHAGCPRRLSEVGNVGDVRHRQAGLRGVEDHGRVGDLPIPADLGGAAGRVRADHRGHRRRVGDLAQHGRDLGVDRRGAHAAVAGPPHNLILVSGVPGERLFQQGQRGRGAGSRQGESVGVRRPRGPAAHPHHHQECQPPGQNPRTMPEAPASHRSHVRPLI